MTDNPKADPVATEWRPIATAPKDGTEVLAYEAGSVIIARFASATEMHGASVPEEYTDWYGDEPRWWHTYGAEADPTLWMPLPPLPAPPVTNE